jgi:hypothetical protein
VVNLIILISKNGEKVIENQNQNIFLFTFSKKKKKQTNRQNKATAYNAQWAGLLGLPNPIIVQNGYAPWTNHENHYIMGTDVYCASSLLLWRFWPTILCLPKFPKSTLPRTMAFTQYNP